MMEQDELEVIDTYKVVINHEEQYSIWQANRENPLGWNDVGKSGTKQECLDYIDEVWTDMRPLSLRKKMEELAKVSNGSEQKDEQFAQNGYEATEDAKPYRDELVDHLASDKHPVSVNRVNGSAEKFKQRIERGYVLIEFTNGQGGTELGVRLDMDTTDLSEADFQASVGEVHLEGELTLNYVEVRCLADIDLATFKGTGQLQIVEE